MIEFSKIKKITIKEGVVKKITNSSGVVLWSEPSTDTGSITVDLNNQWVESTKKLDGYLVYMSNSNKGVNNGYASMKIKFKGMPNFKLWINSYAESSYDYTIAFNMDVDYPTSNPSSGKLSTSGFQKDPTTIDNFKEVDYPNDGGEHFVVVTFRKDSSANANDDRGYVAVKLKLLSTTWVLSSTEFVKENDKYYQRINEVGTYEGGLTAPTGSFKKGNELTPTYIQSDANDYMLVGSKMYYKKYAFVTPVDTAINTGDYIQGDYIGEATPSMKVIYTDNSEKTFYNLTSIEAETIPNKANAKSVEIYDGVTSIGQNAFSYCQALSSINIPNSVVSIDFVAFLDCSSITSINIPSGVTGIESGTFAGCSGLTSITIPSGVTYISNQAFQNCSSITSITIPSGVTYISNQAFQDCIKLAEVTIENSTSKLAYNTNAFGEISLTAKLYVPSNLLSEYQADENWTGAFPGGIYAIGDTSSITVDLNNQWVASTKKLDGYLVLMSNSNKGKFNSYASMKIKFKGKPDFKIWINSYAEGTADYTIAFDMDVDYPTSNPYDGSDGVKLHTSGFQKDPSGGIENFKEVDYPNDGGEHFAVVTYRKGYDWKDENDDRGYVAIKAKLLSTTWVVSQTEFIKDSDKYYQRVNEVETYEGGLTFLTGNFKKGNELTPSYVQSDDSDYILVGASMYYKKYIWITPVDTAINTGDYIQGDYIGEATASVKVTYTDDTEKTYYNLTSITKSNISSDKAKNILIYDSVKSIDSASFYVNTTLTSVTIPNSVTSIGAQAFDTCTALTSLVLPNSITSVNYQTFGSCRSLSSVTLPDSIIVISDRGFYNCESLTSITIPSSVSSIGDSAFRYCRGLTSVNIYNSNSKIKYQNNAFNGISSTAKLYVPSNLLSEYQADENWTGAFPGGIYAIGS